MSKEVKVGERHIITFCQNSYDNKINNDCMDGFLNHKFDFEVKRLDRLEKINGKWTQPFVIVKNKKTE